MPDLGIVYALAAAAPSEIVRRCPPGYTIHWLLVEGVTESEQFVPLLMRLGRLTRVSVRPGSTVWHPNRPALAGVTTFSEQLISHTAAIAADLGLPFHSCSAARLLTNKKHQRDVLDRKGLSSVASVEIHDIADLELQSTFVGFPLVIKPLRGAGSRHTYRLTGASGLVQLRSTIPAELWTAGLVAEGEISGTGLDHETGLADYVSVESLSARGKHRVLAVLGQFPLAEPFRECGSVCPAGLTEPDLLAVRHQALAALSAMGVESGVSHIEVKLTPSGPQIIEVNGRLGGSSDWLVRRSGGPSLIRLAMDLAVGSDPAIPDWSPHGVAFSYLMPGPSVTGTVRGIQGQAEIASVPGVERVKLRIPRSGRYDWTEGTLSAVAQIWGWAESFGEVHSCIEECRDMLKIDFDAGDAQAGGADAGASGISHHR